MDVPLITYVFFPIRFVDDGTSLSVLRRWESWRQELGVSIVRRLQEFAVRAQSVDREQMVGGMTVVVNESGFVFHCCIEMHVLVKSSIVVPDMITLMIILEQFHNRLARVMRPTGLQ